MGGDQLWRAGHGLGGQAAVHAGPGVITALAGVCIVLYSGPVNSGWPGLAGAEQRVEIRIPKPEAERGSGFGLRVSDFRLRRAALTAVFRLIALYSGRKAGRGAICNLPGTIYHPPAPSERPQSAGRIPGGIPDCTAV